MFLFDRIKKGQTLIIPILAMNRDKSIWGQDSMEFMLVHVAIPCSVCLIPPLQTGAMGISPRSSRHYPGHLGQHADFLGRAAGLHRLSVFAC